MTDSAEYGSIGPYKIVRRLGFGRKSEVLLATRLFPGNFERRVVIKRLLARCEDDPERQAVLGTEALAYARVAHPAIVQLFDFFSHEGHLALVLEYIDGLSLARLLEAMRARREAYGDRVALFIASRVFAALAAAHAARDPRSGAPTPVIHRDVSPENVLVPWDGFVKLGDFDLAKVLGVSGDTRSGLMKGTYGYMAPEQVMGDPVTTKTDVYAGCLVLRELLLGRPAFDERLPELELLRAMLESPLPPIESLRSGIPGRLADAMRRGLARDPAQRTLTPGEMVEVLRGQTDMEAAHAELIGVLARLRPAAARGTDSQRTTTPPSGLPATSSRWGANTPRTMTISSSPESFKPVEQGRISSFPPSAAPTSLAALAVGKGSNAMPVLGILASIAFIGVAFAIGRSLDAPISYGSDSDTRTASPPPADVAAVPAVPPSASIPVVVPSQLPTPAVSTGMLVTPASAHRHRVWLDGHLASWSSGTSIRVPCGTHVVRIGSAGVSQSIDVPCGGQVTVDAH